MEKDTNKVIHLDIMKMRMEIGNTSLQKLNQAKAVEDLEKCISTPREMWRLAEIFSDSKPIVKSNFLNFLKMISIEEINVQIADLYNYRADNANGLRDVQRQKWAI